jgi:hypothetical protein
VTWWLWFPAILGAVAVGLTAGYVARRIEGTVPNVREFVRLVRGR